MPCLSCLISLQMANARSAGIRIRAIPSGAVIPAIIVVGVQNARFAILRSNRADTPASSRGIFMPADQGRVGGFGSGRIPARQIRAAARQIPARRIRAARRIPASLRRHMTWRSPGSSHQPISHTYPAGKYGLNLESHTHTKPTGNLASKGVLSAGERSDPALTPPHKLAVVVFQPLSECEGDWTGEGGRRLHKVCDSVHQVNAVNLVRVYQWHNGHKKKYCYLSECEGTEIARGGRRSRSHTIDPLHGRCSCSLPPS